MATYEGLYDVMENVTVQFIGMTTDKSRYDFGIMYSNLFFGKPLIICMQTGQSFLMSAEDAEDVDYLQRKLKITDRNELKKLSQFFRGTLPFLTLEPQYVE